MIILYIVWALVPFLMGMAAAFVIVAVTEAIEGK